MIENIKSYLTFRPFPLLFEAAADVTLEDCISSPMYLVGKNRKKLAPSLSGRILLDASAKVGSIRLEEHVLRLELLVFAFDGGHALKHFLNVVLK